MVMITATCYEAKRGGSYSQSLTSTGRGGYIFCSVASVKESKQAVVPNVLSPDPPESAGF